MRSHPDALVQSRANAVWSSSKPRVYARRAYQRATATIPRSASTAAEDGILPKLLSMLELKLEQLARWDHSFALTWTGHEQGPSRPSPWGCSDSPFTEETNYAWHLAFGMCERSDGRVYYGVKRDISIDPSRRALDASSRFSTAAPFRLGYCPVPTNNTQPTLQARGRDRGQENGFFQKANRYVTLARPYNAVAKTQSLESHFFSADPLLDLVPCPFAVE